MATGRGQNWRKGVLKLTVDQIWDGFAEYVDECSGADKRPTWEGFAWKMGVASSTMLKWMAADCEEDEGYNPEVREALKKIQDWFTDALLQRDDTMAVFSLKQPRYGGYTDRRVVDNNATVKLNVSIKGVDGAFD